MAEEKNKQQKWQGKASIELKGSSATKVWSLIQDFCNIHKWFPVDTCSYVEGVPGEPGLIRYCSSTKTSSIDGQDVTTIKWAKETLTMIDPIKRCLSYELLDNNMGFKYYVATWEILPINGDYDVDMAGCKIQWSFVSDPVEGWRFEDMMSYIEYCLQYLANKLEDGL